MRLRAGLIAAAAVLLVGCANSSDEARPSDPPSTAPDQDQPTPASLGAPTWLLAGDGTSAGLRFDQPLPNLSADELGRFEAGETTFQESFRPASGLGPDFNADGCATCHVENARQATAITNGYVGIGPVVHVSAPGAGPNEEPFALPGYGIRLQTYALAGPAEAQVNVLWETEVGSYPDGTTYELRYPVVSVVGREGMLPADAQISLRIPPQVAGPGLLEFVPETDIIAAADPDDADGDGISGRVQWVPDGDDGRVGRHGWKAETFDLIHQSAGALAEDMGIGTTVFPVAGQVEVDDDELADLAFYVETLAIPGGRDVTDGDVIAGANLFDSIGCSSCHTPRQRTTETNTPELDGMMLLPFTDLLLHDLGPGLDDGRPVLQASGAEWRTAPLWGVGALPTVNGFLSLLHDGRARTLEEAILWHGGEAESVTKAFMALSADERRQLIRFVESR